MSERVARALAAARLPAEVTDEDHGAWRLVRPEASAAPTAARLQLDGTLPSAVLLRQDPCWENVHLDGWAVVMEDGRRELLRHAPIWQTAHGCVLVTGLGMGCVVRGLLTIPEVTRVDVVELDPWIVAKFGPTVEDPRVTVHTGDATTWTPPADRRYDWAWHDLWSPHNAEHHLQVTHLRMMVHFVDHMAAPGRQGAWAMPREIGRRAIPPLLGMPGRRRWFRGLGRDEYVQGAVL